MAVQTKTIKTKINSVNNIKKITKTMEMVSVSKMKKATDRAGAGKVYSKLAIELLSHISKERDVKHPLLGRAREGGKELVVAISSNKGLCGGYNINISKALGAHKKAAKREVECITIGRQSEKSAKRNGLKIIASFLDFNEKSTSDEFAIVRDICLEKFNSGEYNKVSVLYTEFKSSTTYKPYLMKLIPVFTGIYENELLGDGEDETEKPNLSQYLFEPSKDGVLDQIIPQLIEQALFHAFLESVASEHSARMFAMKNAGDNAGNLLDELTLYFNQARQAAITQEISEIVGGAEAVK